MWRCKQLALCALLRELRRRSSTHLHESRQPLVGDMTILLKPLLAPTPAGDVAKDSGVIRNHVADLHALMCRCCGFEAAHPCCPPVRCLPVMLTHAQSIGVHKEQISPRHRSQGRVCIESKPELRGKAACSMESMGGLVSRLRR